MLVICFLIAFVTLSTSAAASNYEAYPFSTSYTDDLHRYSIWYFDNKNKQLYRRDGSYYIPSRKVEIACYNQQGWSPFADADGDTDNIATLSTKTFGTSNTGELAFWQVNKNTGEMMVCFSTGAYDVKCATEPRR